MKRGKKAETVGPTAQRRRHGKIVVVPGLAEKTYRVDLPELFDLYRRQGKITSDEHAACERFAATYRRAYGSDCQISRYDKGIGGGVGVGQQFALTAIRELARHMGPKYAWLESVCIDGQKMRTLERRMCVRNGDGFNAFKAAIRMITDFWRLPND